MKVNYFGYYIKNTSSHKKYFFDMRDFLKSFCRFADNSFKNRFSHNGEKIYLIHNTGDTFYFLKTRSNELIKKINTSSITINEINSLLERDELLGFSSYLHIKQDHFGFASTTLAPKADVLANYINNIFESIGLTNIAFVPHALMHHSTKSEALSLPFIGKSTIEMSTENSFARDLISLFTANTVDTSNVGSIEITIKPQSNKNIKNTSEKLLNAIPDEGVKRMIIKAKEELSSNLIDLYLVGQGAISDNIEKNKEQDIPNLLQHKLSGNKLLKEKLAEFRSNEEFSEKQISSICDFHNADTWTSLLLNLQRANPENTELFDELNSP